MKNKQEHHEDHHEHDLEILKAVAQAWHGHSGSSRSTANEFDARRLSFRGKPTRFKLEAMNRPSLLARDMISGDQYWDFRQSLWDSYEIVAVSKRLEAGLVLDDSNLRPKRRKESKNSLRNLFYNKMSSSWRFSDQDDQQLVATEEKI